MKKMQNLISIFLVGILLFGIMPKNEVFAQEKTEQIIEEKIKEELGSETKVNVDNSEGNLIINTDLSFDEDSYDIENTIDQEDEEVLDDTFDQENEEDKTTDPIELSGANVSLILDYENNDIKVKSTEIDTNSNETVNEFKVNIENANSEEGLSGEFINTDTGESYDVNTTETQASFLFLIPIGVAIGEALLASLIAAGTAIVISGVTYITLSEFVKRSKSKNHFVAILKDKKLWIGNGISRAKAVSRLRSSKNTWSVSSSHAKSISKEASPIRKSSASEIDGSNNTGKVHHYHPILSVKNGKNVRVPGSHAFYGAPK